MLALAILQGRVQLIHAVDPIAQTALHPCSRRIVLTHRTTADALRLLKLTDRHFARATVRTSLGLLVLAPPNEFLCPVTQEGQHALAPAHSTSRPAQARPPWPETTWELLKGGSKAYPNSSPHSYAGHAGGDARASGGDRRTQLRAKRYLRRF